MSDFIKQDHKLYTYKDEEKKNKDPKTVLGKIIHTLSNKIKDAKKFEETQKKH